MHFHYFIALALSQDTLDDVDDEIVVDTPEPLREKKAIKKRSLTMVNLKINCQAYRCKEFKETAEYAAQLLENVIRFKTPIVIRIDYLIRDYGVAECNPIYVDTQNGHYDVPKALAKQNKRFKFQSSTQEDMHMYVTYSEDYSFGRKIKKGKCPLFKVLTHEIIHGLAFSPSIEYINQFKMVLPPWRHINGKRVFVHGHINKYIYFEGTPFNEYVRKLNKKSKTCVYDQCLKGIENDKGAIRFNQSYYNPKQDANYFKLNNGKVYFSIGELSHLSLNYKSTENFEMSDACIEGSNNKDIIQNIKEQKGQFNTAPYGNKILKMLEKLGYPLNPRPKFLIEFE